MPRSNWATGPPPTKIVCLAGLEVPRIGRRDTPDEPFAFGAREFLRKKVIGKRVSFRIEYVVPGGTRELGVVKLGEESLAEAVVGAGSVYQAHMYQHTPYSEHVESPGVWTVAYSRAHTHALK